MAWLGHSADEIADDAPGAVGFAFQRHGFACVSAIAEAGAKEQERVVAFGRRTGKVGRELARQQPTLGDGAKRNPNPMQRFRPLHIGNGILELLACQLPARRAVVAIGQGQKRQRRLVHGRRARILRLRHIGAQERKAEQRECQAHSHDGPADQDCRNWSTAALVTRHWVPICLPLRSPFWRLARTSDSATPSNCPTCAGVISSVVAAAGAAGVAKAGAAPMPGVACAPMMPPDWFIIWCAIAMPTAICAAIPPAPPAPSPFSSPCAIWNLT